MNEATKRMDEKMKTPTGKDVVQFETGKVYTGKRVGTSCLHPIFKIISRTSKMVTFQFRSGTIKSVKVNYNAANGTETIFPEGFVDRRPVIVESTGIIDMGWVDNLRR